MDRVSLNEPHSAFITDETRCISDQEQVSVFARLGVYRLIHPQWHYYRVQLFKTKCSIHHRHKQRAPDQKTSNIWLCFCSVLEMSGVAKRSGLMPQEASYKCGIVSVYCCFILSLFLKLCVSQFLHISMTPRLFACCCWTLSRTG